MRICLAHKIELDCNARQVQYFAKACGCARKAYNWALDEWEQEYKAYRKAKENNPENTEFRAPSETALRRKLNSLKKSEFSYMYEVTKCAPQMAIMDLGKAFQNFFRDWKRFHYPRYRKKFVDDKFTISNDQFSVKGCRIRIPNLGWVRMRESVRFENAKILSATVSRRADRWFVSIQVELIDLKHLKPADNQGQCGVDLGVEHLAVVSNGKFFENPKALRKNQKKLRRLQRALARKNKGSGQYESNRLKIARTHARIANIRANTLHQITSYLTSHFQTIVIEDLNVSGMLKNHHLAQTIADVGMYEFRRELEYKAKLRGAEVIVADRYYPSSRLCRFCGEKNEELQLKDRHWVCPHCGARIENRDLNAAMNLEKLAASYAVNA